MRDLIMVADAILRHHHPEAEAEGIDHAGADAAAGDAAGDDHGIHPFLRQDRRRGRREEDGGGGFHQQHIWLGGGDARVEFGERRVPQQVQHRRDLPMRRRAGGVIAVHAGDDGQAGAFRRPHHRHRVEHRPIDHRGAAHGEFRVDEAALEIHHDDADLGAEAERPAAIAALFIDVRHAHGSPRHGHCKRHASQAACLGVAGTAPGGRQAGHGRPRLRRGRHGSGPARSVGAGA